MKKNLFALVALALGIFACQKDQKETPSLPQPVQDTRMYPVRLTLSGFLKKVDELPVNARSATELAARDSALQDKVQHVYYFAYNMLNPVTAVRELHQTPATSGTNFGLIQDSLPTGNYVIILIASRQPLQFNNDVYWARLATIPENGDTIDAPQDIFRARLEVNHPDTNAVNNWREVALNRVISQVQVNVEDATTLETYADIYVKLHQPSVGFYMDNGNGWGYNPTRFTPVLRSGGNTFLTQALPSHVSTPYSVEILAKHKTTGDTVARKTVYGIVAEANRRIELTGKLLGSNDQPSTFGISLNEEWFPWQVIEY
jgi:hypothetical protein